MTPEDSAQTSGCDRIRSMFENSTRLTSTDEHNSREARERPDAWFCELALQETAIEPASKTAAIASSPPQESPSQAGPIATAVVNAVGGSQPSADSGPTSGAASPVDGLRRQHVKASDQGFLRIQVKHYVILLDWRGRTLRGQVYRDSRSPGTNRGQAGTQSIELGGDVRGFGRLFKQAAGRPSSLVDAAARRSRRWFQGKAAARTAFV